MAKAISHYSGKDSRGNRVECAQSESGVWFWREYGFDGYRNSWSRWEVKEEAPKHPIKYRNAYTEEVEYYTEEESKKRLSWGFSELTLISGPYRLRLPNN